MTTYSITSAIKHARTIGSIQRSGRQWLVISPYSSGNPDGPCTEGAFTAYSNARHALTVSRACAALCLLGLLNEDSYCAVVAQLRALNLPALVHAGIAAAGDAT